MSQSTCNFLEKCKCWFEAADSDRNGLTPSELKTAVQKANPQLTDAILEGIFKGIDTDKNGKISWKEFCCDMKKKDPREVKKCELREAFKAIDRDGKGKLDRGDIMAQLQCLGETRTDEEMNILMSKADVDGDGMIDFNEFLESWGSYCN